MLFIFLLLDIIKPLGYTLSVEFLLLGIIFISLNKNIHTCIIFSVIFAYLRSSLIPEAKLLNLIEYPLICLMSHYLLSYFIFAGKKIHVFLLKGLVAGLAIITHIVINSLSAQVFLPLFTIKYLTQSLLIYFFINYLAKQKKCETLI